MGILGYMVRAGCGEIVWIKWPLYMKFIIFQKDDLAGPDKFGFQIWIYSMKFSITAIIQPPVWLRLEAAAMIALLCSVQAEAEHILSTISVSRTSTIGSKSIIEGTLGKNVVFCVGGMGKVNAAHAATYCSRGIVPGPSSSSAWAGPIPLREQRSARWPWRRRRSPAMKAC